MKTRNLILAAFSILALLVTSCEQNPINSKDNLGILPERFGVDIPSSLSQGDLKSAQLKSANEEGDTLSGDEIYELLGLFIHVGDESAQMVENIIFAIAIYNLDEPKTLSFVGDDDKRLKNLKVTEAGQYNGITYDYKLTITDADSESDEDGGLAMEVLWNNKPIEGVAILKPFNIDRTTSGIYQNTMYRIYYSEKGDELYDATMQVEIGGLPLADPSVDPFSIETLKMFVGKKGDIIDVRGNSNHPNAKLFTDNYHGFNWAFVASAVESENIAVAELGLPPSDLNDDSRTGILDEYAIKKVFTEEINQWFIDTWSVQPDSTDLSNYLKNADAPGYFENKGFVQAGVSPGTQYDVIEGRIENLAPFNPSVLSELEIEF